MKIDAEIDMPDNPIMTGDQFKAWVGRTFKSQRQAAIAFGITANTLGKYCKLGEKPVPVTIMRTARDITAFPNAGDFDGERIVIEAAKDAQ